MQGKITIRPLPTDGMMKIETALRQPLSGEISLVGSLLQGQRTLL